MLKESDNPPIAWPETDSIVDFAGQWWVAHTKSRNEKALAKELIDRRVSYFLPMSWKVSISKGRKMRSLLPLFSGYLFFCGDERARLETLKTNRVANLIKVTDQEKFVNELSQIDKALRSGADLTPHSYIRQGQHCRVTAGALAGLEGIVIQTGKSTDLVLQVNMLGQATSVEINMDMIEIVD